MTHSITVDIPINCTLAQFQTILEENDLKFEQTKYKDERMEKDLTVIRGKTVIIHTDNDHIVESYQHNVPDHE